VTDEFSQNSSAQRPAGADIPEHAYQTRNAREHHAAIGNRVGEVERLVGNGEINVAQDAVIKPGGGYDNIACNLFTEPHA
jgi:hypothetical protein